MSFFTRMLTQSHTSDAPIAPQPYLTNLRSTKMFSLIFATIFFMLGASTTLIDSITFEKISISWPVLGPLLILLCFIGYVFWTEHRWKPLKMLRLAAAQGNDQLLAYNQPEPNPEALGVPVKFAMRFSKRDFLVIGLLGSLLFIGLADALSLLAIWLQHPMYIDVNTGKYANESTYLPGLIWQGLVFITIVLGAVLAFILAVLWRQHWMVEVRQDGIRSWIKNLGSAENRVQSMLWHEARLFICYRQPIPWRNCSTLTYELSSASQVVTWAWVQKNESRRTGVVPTIPSEEHQAQMRALCALVAAKTGLLLYDLSARQGVPPAIRD